MKNLVAIFLIIMLAVSANFALADGTDSQAEVKIADAHDYDKQHDRITNEFMFDRQHKSKAKEKHFRESRDMCFKKCRVNIEKIKDCKSRASTESEKAACLSNSKKECLMQCKEFELEKMGFKPNPEKHQSCFKTCNVNKEALKQCRKKYLDRGLSVKGKCLNSSEKACLKSCMK